MGRTFNTLRTNGAAPRPQAVSVAPVEDGAEWVGGDVPFIEVGPRRQIVDGSPDVLAARGPAGPAAPPAPAAPPRHGVSLRPLREAKKSALAAELVAFHDPEGDGAGEYAELLTALIE